MSFCSNCRHKLGLASVFKIKADSWTKQHLEQLQLLSLHLFMKERLLLFIKCTEKDFSRITKKDEAALDLISWKINK